MAETLPLSAFLIYHHDDIDAVAQFVDQFGHVFAAVQTRGVTDGDDFVGSPSDSEIIRAIRDRYIRDAAVAIVLLGDSTWSRRFVDWEIAAALGENDADSLPMLAFNIADAHVELPPRFGSGDRSMTPTTCKRPPATTGKLIDAINAAINRPPRGRCNAPLARSDLRR